ncbi:MFS transporter [Saccharibacillus sp. CPCC 101409]|uniref:MFS transporter n=1 Tax=Saccharibacillus sp. CPCC 101409 TaxID=3058041 RepID=UPI0026736D86|nr:MFS transporter [Saccharibacillus sp. CPCC 101409]MDO3412152.1 MFS transporter [Saccharibacillus sp. CPCC 101409]
MSERQTNLSSPLHTASPRSPFFLLKAFTFFLYGSIVIFTSFFQLYLQDRGMSKLEIGALMAVGPFVSLIANPFWGYFSDRMENTRRTLILMLTGTLLLAQLVFRANSYVTIYLIMLAFFFFQSPMFAQSNTMILGYIDGTARKFGAFRLWGSLGWALTAAAAGFAIDRTGTTPGVAWIFTGLLGFTLLIAFVLPPLRRAADTPVVAPGGFGKVLGNPTFATFLLLGVLVSVPNAMNSTFMTLYITDLGGSRELVGWSVFAASILEAGVFLVFDRFFRRNLNFMMICLTAVSLLFALRWYLMSVVTDPVHIIYIQMMHSVTYAGYFYVGTQMTSMFVPNAYRGTGQALYTLSWSGVSGVIAGVFGGWIFDNFGAPLMYQSGTALAVVGAVGFAAMGYSLHRGGYRAQAAAGRE